VSRLVRQLRRWPVIGAAVVIVIGGGSAAWAMSRSSGAAGSSQLVAAKVTTVSQTVSASGTIAPAHEADLDFAASGRVTHVLVNAGDSVKKGQPLARVGKVSLQAQRAAAAATVSADAAALAADSSGTSQATADAAAVKAAKANLVAAKKAVKAATLRATIAGTVTSVDLTRGQVVSGSSSGNGTSGSNGSGSSTQIVIQSASTFIVNATVDDTEIGQVKKGQSVAVTPAGATFPVTGKVTSVSSVPDSSSGVVSFPITVRLSGHPSGVYAGASATLAITTKSVANVLEIPTLAITYNGSTATVRVNNGGGAKTTTVTVGENYGVETQVLSGIKAGDKVVVTVPSFSRLPAGGGTGEGGGFTRSFNGEGGGTFTGGAGGVPSGGSGSFPSGSGGGFGQ
jgi:RND family efflux transporter MFP subunit